MKLLTRERVVPIISASVSWLNFPTWLRPAFLAEIRKEKEKSGEALLARIEQLIDQVLFDPAVPGQKIGHE